MKELLDFSVVGVNWIPTTLLIFCIIYWLIVILGLLDVDTLDFDIDLDIDIDADVDVNSDVGGSSGGVMWLNHILAFFNLKHIPFMVWLSFLAFPVWGATLYINWILGINNFLAGLVVFLPALFGGLFVAKFLTWPLVSVFKAMDEDAPRDAVGEVGHATTRLEGKKKGQVKVETRGAPVLIMAQAVEGEIIVKGEQVLVIEHLEEENLYVVQGYVG